MERNWRLQLHTPKTGSKGQLPGHHLNTNRPEWERERWKPCGPKTLLLAQSKTLLLAQSTFSQVYLVIAFVFLLGYRPIHFLVINWSGISAPSFAMGECTLILSTPKSIGSLDSCSGRLHFLTFQSSRTAP